MANRRDDYMNKRSWLIDTAETPADKKRLKADLAKLDKKFNPNRVASTSKSKSADGSDTKPYNVRPIKPSEIIQDKPKAKSKTTGIQATKKAVERTVGRAKLAAGMGTTKNKMTQTKPPMKPGTNPKIGTKPKTPVKKKVVQMPSKISPSKMTPAQKAQYLKNPERYDG
jgi:hypothetical protein